MSSNLTLSLAKSESDVVTFWELFDSYIHELSRNVSLGDDFDLAYFCSDEYRDAIDQLRIRHTNPLRILLIHMENNIIGFLMYVTYCDEGGKCFIMECYIEPNYRRLGYGKSIYSKAEKVIHEDGALYVELTPTNEANERFWSSVGFKKTMDMDEDNKYYYRKFL